MIRPVRLQLRAAGKTGIQGVGKLTPYPLYSSSEGLSFFPPIPVMGLSSYGLFVSNTFYITNPGAAFRYTNTSIVGGLTVVGGSNDAIQVTAAGDYLVTADVNWKHTGGGVAHTGRQWLKVNGTDVPLSAVETTINGSATNQLTIPSQWILSLTAGAQIEVWYANDDVTLVPAQSAAVTTAPIVGSWQYNSPAVPAATVTVLQLSS
jgi:hypothetical protein